MKKILASLFVATLLAGCGSGNAEPVKESKVCTFEEDGIQMEMKLDAVDNEVGVISLAMSMEGDFSTVGEEDKATAEAAMFEQMGLDSSAKGVKPSVEFNDTNAVIKIEIDMENADKDVLKAFDLDGFFMDMKLDSNVKELEAEGAICK